MSFLTKAINTSIELQLETLSKQSPWIGENIQLFGEKKRAFVIVVIRYGKPLLPSGNFLLQEGDEIYYRYAL